MIKWDKVVEEAKEVARAYYHAHGVPLTLRGIFYTLVSKEVIPNTRSAYQTLSSYISYYRIIGKFPWYLVKDETRTFTWGEIGSSIVDAEKVIKEAENFANLPQEEKEKMFKKWLKEELKWRCRITVSKWDGQPYSILLIIEKEAQYDTLKMMLMELDWDVSVTTGRGFESTTALKEIAGWIRSVLERKRKPVLLYIYDFDPSGEYAGIYDSVFRILLILIGDLYGSEAVDEYMDIWKKAKDLDSKMKIIEAMKEDNKIPLIYEKIMLTIDQIKQFNLPPEPQDPNVKKKLERDPRAKMFYEKYGFLGQVEIDAMFALRYEEAKKIIDEAIKKYFDFKVYEEVKKKEEELKKKAEELLKE